METNVHIFEDENVFSVDFGDKWPEKWSYSIFPHPLITVDYDDNGNIIAIEAFGQAAKGRI